jgi:branched-chain amino acid transport system substrate-binding protein
MSRAWVAPVILAVVAVLSSCASPSVPRETKPILIGIYADLSSSGAREGNDALKGAQLRFKEANAAGGISGRLLVLKSLDVKQSPTEAVKAFTTLAQEDGASAVIGSTAVNAGLAVSPVADLAKVPLVSLCIDDRITTPEIKPESPDAVGLVRKYTFLMQPSASQIASALSAFAIERFPLRRYATLYDPSSAVSVVQARSFEYALKKAGKIVAASQELPGAIADYPSALAAIKKADVEAIYICGTAEQNFGMAAELKQMVFRPVLLGNQAWFSPLLGKAGDAAENTWFSMAMAPDDPSLSDLGARFRVEYGDDLRPAAVLGWDAAGLVIAALGKAGSSAPQRVRDALELTAGFKGVFAQIDMDKKSHKLVGTPVAIMRITGGRFQVAEPRFVPRAAKPASQ